MRFSVCTPVLNGAKTIARNLQALRQQDVLVEHIVQDGGSTDGTQAIVNQFKDLYDVRLIEERDSGIYDAVYRGFCKSTGDVLSWINADDFYYPWTLAVVAKIFEDNPEVDWVTGVPSWYFESTGLSIAAPYTPIYPRKWIEAGDYAPNRLGTLQQESMFWRRRLWERDHDVIRGIMRTYRYAADFHLWRQFARSAELRTVGSILATFTISAGQVSTVFAGRYVEECSTSAMSRLQKNLKRAMVRAAAFTRSDKVLLPCALKRG